MRIYTIKNQQDIDYLLKYKRYKGNLSKSSFYKLDSFKTAYDWLLSKFNKKFDCPKNKSLIWCWETKPDMRDTVWEDCASEYVYRLTIDIPEELLLFSDFERWHFVLNNIYLPVDLDTGYESDKVEQSWNRIFGDYKEVNQICIKEFSMDQVIKIEKFKVRKRIKKYSSESSGKP